MENLGLVEPLAGKRALVTGASKGIGRAIAETLARAGADVCIVARNPAPLAPVAAALANCGRRSYSAALDVVDRAGCFALVERLHADWGGIDILVNSAGSYENSSFLETTINDFARVMDNNLHGSINMMHATLPAMIAAGFGRIINVASVAGRWGSPNQSAYNVSKHAIVGLTRCVALECARTGVTVNAVCPGLVDTEMFDSLVEGQSTAFGVSAEKMRARMIAAQPINRLLTPEEIASLVLYLAQPIAGGLTGQAILHDGGTIFG